jgi:D-aminopeptidase
MKTLKILLFIFISIHVFAQKARPRELGIKIGVLPTGMLNAITDVPGVQVGHFTIHNGTDDHTGATAILPISGNIFQDKLPAAIFIGNGYGKLAGYTQVEELGSLETPILLTNTLSVSKGMDALVDYTFGFAENKDVMSVNGVVGETNDGGLNDIRKRLLTAENMMQAIANAKAGKVAEGNVGAGAGTACLGFKGGIGTSSRILPKTLGGYTVGVLVQSNFGGVLQVAGVPVGEELGVHKFKKVIKDYGEDGSCMMVVITDAPLTAKNLKRLAARAMLGLARTGGIASNGSGDYVIAVSTAASVRMNDANNEMLRESKELKSGNLDVIFEAVIEATEEAIINSLFAAETVTGYKGYKVEALPVAETLQILKKYGRLN